ncbi:MAG: peptide-methionine (S)-S-oxide reductase MsrA [Vicinamibacterales bacterium]
MKRFWPLCLVFIAACGGDPQAQPAPPAASAGQSVATAVFASGCFWCTESDFDKIAGVVATVSGYTGGNFANPTYEQVSSGGTGHVEAVQVTYDPAIVSYEQLLDAYWPTVDPFNDRGQFCDVGEQYRPVIFVASPEEREAAEVSKRRAEERLGRSVVVAVEPAATFYPAETYHQDYYTKNPARYNFYRWSCGRDARLEEVWGAH